MAIHPIYRFYTELEGYSPKIWRRFEVNGSKTIAELGYILMTMFEMKACHLFCFTYDHGVEILKDMRRRYSDEELDRVLSKSDFADLLKPWRFELPSEDMYENENERWRNAGQYRLKDITDSVPWQGYITVPHGVKMQLFGLLGVLFVNILFNKL